MWILKSLEQKIQIVVIRSVLVLLVLLSTNVNLAQKDTIFLFSDESKFSKIYKEYKSCFKLSEIDNSIIIDYNLSYSDGIELNWYLNNEYPSGKTIPAPFNYIIHSKKLNKVIWRGLKGKNIYVLGLADRIDYKQAFFCLEILLLELEFKDIEILKLINEIRVDLHVGSIEDCVSKAEFACRRIITLDKPQSDSEWRDIYLLTKLIYSKLNISPKVLKIDSIDVLNMYDFQGSLYDNYERIIFFKRCL